MEQNYKRIELSDDYMFSTIMSENRGLCTRVLETILGFEIESLEYVKDEEYIKSYASSHGVRLDVIAKTSGTVYDIEMQTIKRDDIPRRMRYYQSQIDISELDRGRKYRELKDSYIIFICTFDLFEMGEYIYRFENFDCEKSLPLGDGAKKIVINTKGTKGDISQELKEFITYIDKPQEAGRTLQTELVRDIDASVTERNKDEMWREKHMKLELDMQLREDIGMERGIAVGMRRGRKAGIAVGEKRGIAVGMTRGLDLARQIFKLSLLGKTVPEIASQLSIDEDIVRSILE